MFQKILLVLVALTASLSAQRTIEPEQQGNWVGGAAWSWTATPTPFYVPLSFPNNLFTSIECTMEVNYSNTFCANGYSYPIPGLSVGQSYTAAHIFSIGPTGVWSHFFIINGTPMSGCYISYEGWPFEYANVHITCPQGTPQGCTWPEAEFGCYY